MDFEDAKIWNTRFTLLHVAIQELAQLRQREYQALEYRVRVLELDNERRQLKNKILGGVYGFFAGILGGIVVSSLIYFLGVY